MISKKLFRWIMKITGKYESFDIYYTSPTTKSTHYLGKIAAASFKEASDIAVARKENQTMFPELRPGTIGREIISNNQVS